MAVPLHDLGLSFRYLSDNISPEGVTAHYGGPSPWRGADTSSGARFEATTAHARCPTIVRSWHAYHLSKGWAGLAYTSCVCPHGHRYRGRDAGHRTAAQGTNSGNRRSYAVCYIAGDRDPVTDAAKWAYHAEATRLRRNLRWDHSDWKSTTCAGAPMRAWEATGWALPGLPPAPPPPPPPPPPPTGAKVTMDITLPVLARGATSVHVGTVQGLLNHKASQGLTVDNDFGPATDRAVRNWQRFWGLSVDGIVGARTWETLLEIPW